MAYDQPFRTKIVEYFLAGYTKRELSALFNISTSSIKKWTASYRASGTTGGGYRKSGAVRKPRKIDLDKLESYLTKHPNAVLREIAAEFSCGIECARKAVLRNKRRQKTEEQKAEFFSNYPKFWFEG